MRTLETAAGIFGVADPASAAVAAAGAEDMSEDGAQPAVLMLAQSEQASMRVAHEQLFVPPGVSFVAHELCRERLGPSHCDQRRPVTQAAACFPGVDFSLIESDEDQLWAPGNVEAEAQVVHRGMKFLQVSAGGSWVWGERERKGEDAYSCLAGINYVHPRAGCSVRPYPPHLPNPSTLFSIPPTVAGDETGDKHRRGDALSLSLVHAHLLRQRVCAAGA